MSTERLTERTQYDNWTAHIVTRWLLDVRNGHYEANDDTSMDLIREIRERDRNLAASADKEAAPPVATQLSECEIKKIEKRRDDLQVWLLEQAPDIEKEQNHLDNGTIANVYWHYGYFVASRDILRALSAVTPKTSSAAEAEIRADEREKCMEDIQDAIGQWGDSRDPSKAKHFGEALLRSCKAIANRAQGLDLWGNPLTDTTQGESKRATET
jgi:hypothetical protein